MQFETNEINMIDEILRLSEENVLILEKIFFLLNQENTALLHQDQKAFYAIQYAKLQSMEHYESLQLSLFKQIKKCSIANETQTLRQIAEKCDETRGRQLLGYCDSMQAFSGQIRSLIERNNFCMRKYSLDLGISMRFNSQEISHKAISYNSQGKKRPKSGQTLLSIIK